MQPSTVSTARHEPSEDRDPRRPPGGAPAPRRLGPWMLASALALPLAACVAALLAQAPPAAPPAPEPVQADRQGVTIASGAHQWDYLTLAVAAEGPALPPLPVPGRVGFDELRTAAVGVPLAGRIERVLVRLGDSVRKGDPLFSVRSREFADIDKDVAAARQSVEVKRRIRDRSKDLYALNAVPEKELLAADAELQEAALTLKAAEAKRQSLAVAAAGDNLFWVRAPRAGFVVSLDASASQEVSSERADPLLRISDTSEVLVTADVPEADAGALAAGHQALIRTRDGVERRGVVQRVATVVDPQRQTLAVRIVAGNADGALKPNAFVDVTLLPRDAERRVQVDEDAVVSDGDHSSVFVLEGERRLAKRDVQPGRRGHGKVEVLSGVAAGTQYVAKGALLLLNQIDLAD
ncbi:MAG TPA: efflux RND transporter periplasmic adaptor subunit [Myxococcales bacterium]